MVKFPWGSVHPQKRAMDCQTQISAELYLQMI